MDHAAHQQHHEPSPTAATTTHAAGHDRHEGHSVAMFRDKFWLSLVLTVPTVLLSPEVAGWIGYSIPSIPGIEYVPAILGTVIFLYGGMVFIRGAQGELADRTARDDDPHLAGHHRLVRDLVGRHARLLRGRDLVGTRHPDHDHAARPLARDALDRPGARCPRRPRGTPARYGRAGHRQRHRGGADRRPPRQRHRPGPPRCAGARRTAWSSRARPTSTSR